MSNKTFLLQRADAAPFQSGVFSAELSGYQFGARLELVSGLPVARVVVESTPDGGNTWLEVITFDLNQPGDIETPDGAKVLFEGGVARARLLSIEGGQAYITVWMK